MKIFKQLEQHTESEIVLAIGNFDGIHLGHQSIINCAKKIAKSGNMILGVLTFEPHPKSFFDPKLKNFRLTPKNIKSQIMSSLGVENLYIIAFDESLAQIDAKDFIEQLTNKLKVKHIVIGYDFAFGNGGKGNASYLSNIAPQYGFKVTTIPQINGKNNLDYSSTAIRESLGSGNPLRAFAMLGRFWTVKGKVKLGRQTGITLGFPTANISIGNFFKPKEGIYAIFAKVIINGKPQILKGVANIGGSPTFNINTYLVEAHLFNFSGDIYKKNLTVALVDYIREPIKFNNINDLIKEIKLDAEKAMAILSNYEKNCNF